MELRTITSNEIKYMYIHMICFTSKAAIVSTTPCKDCVAFAAIKPAQIKQKEPV